MVHDSNQLPGGSRLVRRVENREEEFLFYQSIKHQVDRLVMGYRWTEQTRMGNGSDITAANLVVEQMRRRGFRETATARIRRRRSVASCCLRRILPYV